MNIVASVPMITPKIIANTNERIASPPSTKIQSNTRSVEHEVMTVRPSVELIEVLIVV